MTQATIRFDADRAKWVGEYKGKKVRASWNKDHVLGALKAAGYTVQDLAPDEGREAVVEDAQAQWPINQRFEFVTQLVSMVARGDAVSAIITGPGGLGKTHTVRAALRACGLTDASSIESEGGYNSYRMIKGYSTAKGLYRELYNNRDGVLVFDDCDSIQKDPIAVNLLKGALDSYDQRVISWNADMKDDDLPRSFVFNGRVLFISNMERAKIDNALLTRAYCVDLAMTTEQKLERMAFMVNDPEFMPRASAKHKADAMRVIQQLGSRNKELSLRTLQAITRIRASGNANWELLSEYVLTNS